MMDHLCKSSPINSASYPSAGQPFFQLGVVQRLESQSVQLLKFGLVLCGFDVQPRYCFIGLEGTRPNRILDRF